MVNKPPDSRLELLVDKNSKLSSQLDVQRKHVAHLEKKIDDLHKKEDRWKETLLCVNRLWDELNSSIAFLQYRAGGTLAVGGGSEENTEATDASLLQQRNPFLAKLVSAFLPDDKQAQELLDGDDEEEDEADEGLAEIEAALRKRMAGTVEASVQVLKSVEDLRAQRQAQQGEAVGGSGGGGSAAAAATAPPSSPTSPPARASGGKGRGSGGSGGGGEGGSSRSEAQLAALVNLLRSENNRLRDQALKDGHKMRQLSNALADREDELLVAKRKLTQLKSSSHLGEVEAPAPQAAGPSSAGQAGAGPSALAAAASSAGGPRPGGAAAGGSEDAAALQRLLEKRTAELDSREEALMRAEREGRDLRDRLASEREAAGRAKQYDAQRLAMVNSELGKLADRYREVLRERDHCLVRAHDLQFQAEQGLHARRQLSMAEAHIQDVEGRVAALRATKAELEAQLLRERSKPNSAALIEELRALVDSLQRDKAQLEAAAARHKGTADRLEAVQQQAQEWLLAAEKARAELGVLGGRLEQHKAAASAYADKENQWKEREADLRLFVEVTHAFVGESRELEEVRAAEAKLREQVSELQSKLAGHPLQAAIDSLKAREAELEAQVEALGAERAQQQAEAQGLQRTVADLREQLAAVKAESEEYINEIERVGQAYEGVQAQNARLLAALGRREEDQARLLAESAAAAQERASLAEERDSATKAAARAEEAATVLKRRVTELEGRVQALVDELSGAKGEVRQLAARCEAAIQDLMERDALLAAQRADLDAARKEAAERAGERDAEVEGRARERQRAERLQEQLEEAQSKLERVRRAEAGPGAAGRELQAECDALRKLINCNVCHQRQKDVVITKCWHIFCSECIRRNLETRHRKCPGCGTPFGQGDVKQFFFT